ncbi:helix-hairpin-helix domain-containing protein [Micromonospora sp. NPDC004540]|uniref:ComEA family DNA-binding protein n=1 Tax=Micromonospora sp. NPDC004540 TaxID=3154457 RepID=UPI0033B5A2CB
MSNTHNGGWVPAPGAANQVPTNPAASRDWRIRQSLWLLLPILGCSCLGGAGLIYVGLRARRAAWWIPGIVYMLVGWAAFAVTGESDQQSALSSVATAVVLASWIANILHACLINPAWLRWRASHTPWYAQPTAPPPTWPGNPYPPTTAPPTIADLTTSAQAYYGAGPAATSVPQQPAPPVTPPAPPSPPATAPRPLDVNAATFEELAALPGFGTERASRVLAERHHRRGFGSIEDFAMVANLAPHEFAHLRNLLTCTPPPQPPAGYSPHGRVLDV